MINIVSKLRKEFTMCNVDNGNAAPLCWCGSELKTIYTQFSGKCIDCERFEESTGLSAKAFKPTRNSTFPEIETCGFTERLCGSFVS
jgi:hypothetical protein